MGSILEGGCRVAHPREVKPLARGNLHVWPLFGRANGTVHVSLRLLEFGPGSSPSFGTPRCDEVWYVLRGSGTLLLNGRRHSIAAEAGVYIAPGSLASVHNPTADPLAVMSSRCPDPEGEDLLGSTDGAPAATPQESKIRAAPVPVVRLADREAVPTGDRWYRVLVDASVGSTQVTQFVGSIPPGRAPDHFHDYEEVLCILEGQGTMWAGSSHAAIGPRSCVYLPKGQRHCVENTGPGALQLLGVFYPAGSPGARTADDAPAGGPRLS